MDLDAHHAVDHEHGAFADPQRRQGVGHEAGLAGVSIRLILRAATERGEAGRDRHLARLLVRGGVRHGRAVGDGAQAVDRSRLEQQGLVQGGLTDSR